MSLGHWLVHRCLVKGGIMSMYHGMEVKLIHLWFFPVMGEVEQWEQNYKFQQGQKQFSWVLRTQVPLQTYFKWIRTEHMQGSPRAARLLRGSWLRAGRGASSSPTCQGCPAARHTAWHLRATLPLFHLCTSLTSWGRLQNAKLPIWAIKL